MARALWLCLLLGCGATSSQGTSAPTDEVANDSDEDSERVAVEADVEDVEEVDGASAPTACADRDASRCTATDGCVLERSGTCREATHECERIEFDRRTPTPVFDRGDPCQRANPTCAWSNRTGRCAPFEAVPSCPATTEEAAALTVQCNHSDQPELRCSYPGTECACRRRPYCGGAAPSPAQRYPPTHFTCVPDFDTRGCPNREVRRGTRCDVDPSVRCVLGCYTGYRCERGRWREYRLPPRP